MKICFASHNHNKVKEIDSLAPDGIRIYGLEELGVNEEIPETGQTMEENSSIKAEYVYNKFNVPVFSDDSGLEVQALNGEPGVYSARYAGPEKDHEQNMDLLLKNLSGKENRSAQFKSVITFIDSLGEKKQFTGTVEGEITKCKEGTEGFGYDPIFTPSGYQKTFAQMTPEEKNALSHRAKAFDKLLSHLQHLK